MFDFGIAGYRPSWLNSRSEVVREHAHRLSGLAGRTLTRAWMVWNRQDDEWFCDCPVLFDFEGEQVEINHHKFDDLSLTWNTIDPSVPVRWPGFDLQWRAEPLTGLRALRGLALQGVELLEWTGEDLAQGNVDVSFVFETGRVTVLNALDENGLSFAPPDQRQRLHSLNKMVSPATATAPLRPPGPTAPTTPPPGTGPAPGTPPPGHGAARRCSSPPPSHCPPGGQGRGAPDRG